MKDAIDWALGQIHRTVPTDIVYRRGGVSVPLIATKGASHFQSDQADEYVQHAQTFDFLIRPAALAIGGEKIEPLPGDEIDELNPAGEVVRTYAVLPQSGVGPWSWSDPWRTMLRIHTQLIREADA